MAELNPDSIMLRQSDGMWQKYCALVLSKVAPEGAMITAEDIVKFQNSGRMLLIHGHRDRFELKLVTPEEAEMLAQWDSERKGTA